MLHDRAPDFVLGHGDLVLARDLVEQKPETDAAIGDPAIFLPLLVLGRVLVLEGLAALLHLGVHGLPQILEFLLDQRRRQWEFMPLVQRIEQRPLDALLRHRIVLALNAFAHRGLQLVERIQSERLGEFVVDRDRARRFDRFGGGVEHGLLSGQRRRRIILREGHGDLPVLANADPDQLIFEARNEGAASDHHGDVLGGAALERHTVDGADERNGDAVVLLGLGALGLGGEGAVLFGDPLETLFDLLIGGIGGQPGQVDGL